MWGGRQCSCEKYVRANHLPCFNKACVGSLGACIRGQRRRLISYGYDNRVSRTETESAISRYYSERYACLAHIALEKGSPVVSNDKVEILRFSDISSAEIEKFGIDFACRFRETVPLAGNLRAWSGLDVAVVGSLRARFIPNRHEQRLAGCQAVSSTPADDAVMGT
jgi:hypothetical protein